MQGYGENGFSWWRRREVAGHRWSTSIFSGVQCVCIDLCRAAGLPGQPCDNTGPKHNQRFSRHLPQVHGSVLHLDWCLRA